MIRLHQSGAVRWFALVLAATGSVAMLGAGLTWSASSTSHASLAIAAHGAISADAGGLSSPHGLIDFTPDGSQPGLSNQIQAPSSCDGCHGDGTPDTPDSSFLPLNTWGGSMMAHATRDPLFWAALDVANADVPGVGDYCLRCHTPTGWLEGRVSKTTIGTTVDGEDGCQLQGDHDDPDFAGNDYSGLTCEVCHRMTETGPAGETARLENANFWIDDAAECVTPNGTNSGPCRHGPYDYEAGDPLSPSNYHGWVYSPFLDRGPVCGTCHDVSTPITSDGPLETLILPDGSDSGLPMPVERTFTEWKRSDFGDVIFRDRLGDDFDETPQLARGATCQDCHMASSEDPLARACRLNPAGSREGELPVHEFVGANTWVPAIIRDEYAQGVGGAIAVANIDQTIARARDMLTLRSATIQTTAIESAADELTASVRVTNLAGHKLPTGYAEGRRMWLHVVARDASNAIVWENGAWDPATGVLSEDAQTKIYETLQGEWDSVTQTCKTEDAQGRKQFHFVLNNCIAKDNRIPPLGFTGGSDLETRPVGYAYPPAGPGRLANFDDTQYVIPLPPGTTGAITVTATLKFQIASNDYITFLRDEAVDPANNIQPENTMCMDGPGRPFNVGPQGQTRGEFMYDLWSNPAYGRSPPDDMVSASDSVTL